MAMTTPHPFRFSRRQWFAMAHRLQSNPKAVLLISVVAASLLGLGASIFIWHNVRQQRLVAADSSAVLAQLSEKQRLRDGTKPMPAPADFTERLGRPDLEATLSTIQRACEQTTVTLSGMQLQPRAAAAQQLFRTELTVSLRGSYPNLKLALSGILERSPNMTVAHMTLRRAAAPATDAEATIELALWGAPVAAPPSRAPT